MTSVAHGTLQPDDSTGDGAAVVMHAWNEGGDLHEEGAGSFYQLQHRARANDQRLVE